MTPPSHRLRDAALETYAIGLALAGVVVLLLIAPAAAVACELIDAFDRPTPEEAARRRWRYG